MDLTQMSLEEFLNEDRAAAAPEAPPFEFGMITFGNLVGEWIRDLHDGYALHRMGDDPGNVALCQNGTYVGCYFTDVISIALTAQNQKLSTPLILEAVKWRPKPAPRKLSDAGRAALTRAWRVAHQQASGIATTGVHGDLDDQET